MTSSHPIVFLVDVDKTLFNNDAIMSTVGVTARQGVGMATDFKNNQNRSPVGRESQSVTTVLMN